MSTRKDNQERRAQSPESEAPKAELQAETEGQNSVAVADGEAEKIKAVKEQMIDLTRMETVEQEMKGIAEVAEMSKFIGAVNPSMNRREILRLIQAIRCECQDETHGLWQVIDEFRKKATELVRVNAELRQTNDNLAQKVDVVKRELAWANAALKQVNDDLAQKLQVVKREQAEREVILANMAQRFQN